MRERSGHRAPIRLWSPSRFRTLVSAVAAAAAGLVPAAVVLIPATPAYAAGEIIIVADLDDVEGNVFQFEIKRVGPTSTPFTLTYETVTSGLPSFATPVAGSGDFTAITNGSAVFDPSTRDVVKRIAVTGFSDQSDEPNEWFGLSLTNVNDPYNNLALGKLTDDDDPPTYSFGSPATVAENAGSVTATATLSAPSAFPVTIPYTTNPGTATDGQDYTAQTGTLSFAPGDATKDVVVPILDDSQNEDASETFTVTSTAGTTGATEATTSKTVTITDDDAPPTVSIGSGGSVREGDTMNFPVNLSGPSRLPVTVTADATGGSATSGADYDAVSSVPVEIPAGQTTANLPVVTKPDANDESGPGETVQVTISGETNATLGTAQNTGTIVDSVVAVSSGGAITEADTGTRTQTFTVTLSAAPTAPAAPIEIGYSVAAGTAQAGVDFDTTSGTLSFGVGQTSKTFTVAIHGDAVYEGNENISVALSHGAGKVTGGLGPTSFDIVDDDALPTIASVAPVSVAETESDHVEDFVVTLSNPSNEAVTVNVTNSDISAVEASSTHGSDDYDVIDNTSVEIAAGAMTANIRVRVKGDAIYEGEETATITATVDGGESGATPGSTQSGTLTITNEDALPVITLNNLTGAEGNATLAVNATVSGTAQDPISYTMSATDGTAESLDYNASGLVSGAIDPEETSLSLGTVSILPDDVDDAVDAFNVTITPTGGAAAKTATVTITDDVLDTAPKIVGTTAPSPVAENAGPVVVPVALSYTGSSANSTENVISVDYATSPGTAKATLDYTTESGTLTFTPGQADPVLDIALYNDNYFEINEDFTVTLSNPQGTATLEQDTATITVTDEDGSPPTFTVAQTGAVTEGGLATFTITMNGPAAVDTIFDITHTIGGAVADDYTDPTGGVVTVNKDQTTATFTVQTTADNIYEGAETATITATRASGMTSVAAGPQSGTLTITEDDPVPTLILNSVNTNEDAGTFDITATRTGVAEDDMSYTVTVASDGDATDPAGGGDFTAAPNTVIISGGTPASTVTTLHSVALTDDTIDENTEGLKATVVNDTVSTPNQTSTYGILDSTSDLSPKLVYGSPVTVAEGGGPALIPVSKDWTGLGGTNATEKTITVDHATVDGTATAANDFDSTLGSGTLSFGPNDNTKNISVPLKTDSTYELTEQFVVRLSNPSGGSTIPTPDDTVTITDDDAMSRPAFSVEPSTPTTATEGQTVTYTIQLNEASLTDTDFDVTLSGGTAQAGGMNPGEDDYAVPSTPVRITAGNLSATVSIPLNTDTTYEGTETSDLSIALASGETDVTGTPQTRTITITDADTIPTLALTAASGQENNAIAIAAVPTGVAQHQMTYTLTVAGDAAGGNAAEVEDYTHSLTTVNVPAGSPDGVPIPFGNVTAAPDTVDEPNETFRVTARNDTYNTTPNVSELYTITDDGADTAPNVTLASPTTVAEAGGSATVPVTLDFSGAGSSATHTEKAVTVDYTTNSGTATPGTDYTSSAATQAFTPLNNTANITVPIDPDSLYETNEQFGVTISNPVNASLGTATNTVTINDDDTGAIPGFSVSTDPTAIEGTDASVTLTVTLDTAAADTIDLDATLADVTTTDGGSLSLGTDDYTAPAVDFTIAKDQRTATVNIPIADDDVYEGAETFTVQIALDSGETLATGAPVTRTVTITDDESVPTLTMVAASAAENAPLTVDAVTNGVAEDNMDYTLTFAGEAVGPSGNAAEGADYTDSGALGTVTGGTPSGTTVTLRTVGVDPDTIDEPNETFRVTARNDTYTTTPNVSELYTITDDGADTAPNVTLGSPVTVAEAAGSATVPVTLDFSGAGSSATHTEKAVTVDYTTNSGTATPGTDYTSSAASLAFSPLSNTANISVPIDGDSLFETNEQFGVTISNPADATLGTATNTVTINDDDSSAIPGFTVSADQPVVEGPGATAQFTVTLDSAAADTIDFDATIVDVTTTDAGDASLGKDDHTAPAVDFTIAKDSRTATVNIPITNDPVYEGAETFTVQIARDSGETLATGAPVTRTVTITDDESVPTLTMAAAGAAENASAPVTATVTGVAERDMVYSLALAGDATGGNNAAETGDFTNNPVNTTVNGGTASGATVNLGSIPLLTDQIDEPVETIKATVTNTTYSGEVSAFYTVTDDPNDNPPSVSLGPVTVSETAGAADVPVTLTFLAGNGATSSEQAVSITHQVTGITADGLDFGLTTNPAVIAAGATTGAIRVPITDDIRFEPTETFQVRATAVSPAGAAIGADTGLVTITDNDVNVERPTFSVDSQTVSESAGSATFTVSLSTAAPAAVDLTVNVADGTATESGSGIGGDDYDRPAGTVRIAEGARSATFTVPVRDDKIFEHEETARVTVALAGGEEDATGAAKESTLTIGNDEPQPVLTMTATGSAAEGETMTVTGTVDAVAQPALRYGTPEIRTTGTAGTADFTFRGGEVAVPGGTAPSTTIDIASIKFNDDTVDEDTETVVLALGTRTGTYRITDDPQDAAPSVSISDETIGESEGSVDLTVSLALPDGVTGTERTVTVPWKTVPGTAESGGDYVTTTGTATFEPGTKTATVKVPITPDGIREDEQEFTVRLGEPTPTDVKVAKADGTVTIEDDDTAVRPTLTVASAVITGSQRVKLTGTAAPGAKVELLTAVNPTGSGGYRVVLTAEADSDGDFSFNPNFTQGYRIYARANGLVSPVRTVTVRQDPAITATSSSRGTATVTVTGDPGRPGQTVTVQRLSGGAWSRVASGKLDEDGEFRTVQRSLRSGSTYTYRAVIAATPSLGILAGTSPTRAVRVR